MAADATMRTADWRASSSADRTPPPVALREGIAVHKMRLCARHPFLPDDPQYSISMHVSTHKDDAQRSSVRRGTNRPSVDYVLPVRHAWMRRIRNDAGGIVYLSVAY
jgi:hypothetical protein